VVDGDTCVSLCVLLHNWLSGVDICRFVAARALGDVNETLEQCRALLEEPEIEAAVRIGDIYAYLIEYVIDIV
jgi:hypothetical protein